MKQPPSMLKVSFYSMGVQGRKKEFKPIQDKELSWIQMFLDLVDEMNLSLAASSEDEEEKRTESYNEVIFLYAKRRDLTLSGSYDALKNLYQNYSQHTTPKKIFNKKDSVFDYAPPIIVYSDQFDLINQADEDVQAIEKRLLFWDSSIWFRYVYGKPNSQSLRTRVKEVLSEVQFNYSLGLYHTVAAREFLELQVRLLRENKLGRISGSRGHKAGVIPFQYRSETKMKRLTSEYIQKISELTYPYQLSWNTFLIDDFADRYLRMIKRKGAAKTSLNEITKSDLLNRLFEDFQHITLHLTYLEENSSTAEFDSKKIIPDFLRRLEEENQVFDVIFLDYFLGEKLPENQGQRFFFGFELLEKISTSRELQAKANPFGKFWIFPISSFPYAFKTHVAARGDENFTAYWNLSDGGNPVNCPHHFRMKLLKLLYEQVRSVSLDWEQINQVLNKILGKRSGKNNGLLASDPRETFKGISQRAKEEYAFFTERLANMYRLDRDKNGYMGLAKTGLAESLSGSPLVDQHKLYIRHLEQIVRMFAFEAPGNRYKIAEKLSQIKQLTYISKYGPRGMEREDFFHILREMEQSVVLLSSPQNN